MDKIAVLIPCYNESATITKVVNDFRAALPESVIYVYDNNSNDGSGTLAAAAGAIVRKAILQGKGHVVRRMFQDVDAEIYVMVDADDTYPADEVSKLITPIAEGVADMVNGDRLSSTYLETNKRLGHNFGNLLVRRLIRSFFHCEVKDVMTGYRAFSRRFVKTCPVLSGGFEIETEMTLHTLDKRLPFVEVPIMYRDRPAGSASKLRTFSDGFKVLRTIFDFFRIYRPFVFFGVISSAMAIVSVVMMTSVFCEYFRTGLVPRFPTLIFSCFLLTGALISLAVALILDAVKKQSDQTFELRLS